MSYRRHSYDINRWSQNEIRRRPRSAGTRWFLLFGCALALAMPVICILGRGGDRDVVNIVGYLPLLTAVGLSPFGRDSVLLTRRLAAYDEFERDALAQATRRAFVVLLALVTGGAAWMWAAMHWPLPVPATSQAWSACFFTLLSLGIALPVVFAEWAVPLPPPLDEELEDL